MNVCKNRNLTQEKENGQTIFWYWRTFDPEAEGSGNRCSGVQELRITRLEDLRRCISGFLQILRMAVDLGSGLLRSRRWPVQRLIWKRLVWRFPGERHERNGMIEFLGIAGWSYACEAGECDPGRQRGRCSDHYRNEYVWGNHVCQSGEYRFFKQLDRSHLMQVWVISVFMNSDHVQEMTK